MKKIIQSEKNDPIKMIGNIILAAIAISMIVLFTFFTNGHYIAHF